MSLQDLKEKLDKYIDTTVQFQVVELGVVQNKQSILAYNKIVDDLGMVLSCFKENPIYAVNGMIIQVKKEDDTFINIQDV